MVCSVLYTHVMHLELQVTRPGRPIIHLCSVTLRLFEVSKYSKSVLKYLGIYHFLNVTGLEATVCQGGISNSQTNIDI